jgi:hypothetical protein
VRGPRPAGLGKGLAAILPSQSAGEASPGETALEPLLREVVDGCLDALRAAVPVDLCAYLHWPEGFGAQLHLGVPTLADLDAGSAFDLLDGLRGLAEMRPPGPGPDVMAGFLVTTLHSHGEHSRGLFVAGRRKHALHESERAVIVPICRAMALAVHALETAMRRQPAERTGALPMAGTQPEGLVS